jgi:predicted ester cyclase/uncharacterized protein YndB with AHSA1/START domain
MISVEREVVVQRPPHEVFAFLADARNEQSWNPNVKRIALCSAGPIGRGSIFEGTYRRGGRMRFALTEYDPPSRLVFAGGRKGLGLVATIEIGANGHGTAVRMRADLEPPRVLSPLMRPLVERQYADVAERFRAAVDDPLAANKALYRRWFEDVVGGALELADELLAPDYRLHFPGLPGPVDREGHKQLVTMFRSAFPDWVETVEDVIAEGDRVVIRVTGCGTHEGEFQGIAATGKRVSASGIGIGRIAGGRIAEAWAAYDAAGLHQQLTSR